MRNWKIATQVCGAIGVVMSAAQVAMLDVLEKPYSNMWIAIQTAIIALGLYCSSQIPVPEIVE